MPAPLATPKLLTRMSSPPNVSTVRETIDATPSAVARSAATASTRAGPLAPASALSSAAASCSFASPRAQIVTRQPSATSARAVARPSPLLDPVTIATLSVSSRSTLASPSTREVVQRPVERGVRHLQRILREKFLLDRQQRRLDERERRALDWAARGEQRGRLGGVARRELLLAPREDRADADRAVLAIDGYALRAGHALTRDVGELLLQARARERLAAQPSAADRAAAQRKVHARIVEAGEHGLLNLVERQRPAGDAVRQPLVRAGNLAEALRRVVARTALKRIVIGDGPQHKSVVGVQPERDLFVARQAVDRHGGELRHVPVEFGALRLDGAVVDVAVADVEIEELVERPRPCRFSGFLRGRRSDDEQGQQGRDDGDTHKHLTTND